MKISELKIGESAIFKDKHFCNEVKVLNKSDNGLALFLLYNGDYARWTETSKADENHTFVDNCTPSSIEFTELTYKDSEQNFLNKLGIQNS